MDDRPALRRDIGFRNSAFLSFNGIVGAGIFALPATLHAQFGAFSPWLFPIFGLLVLIVALPFARLAALVPTSGGPAAYAGVFGPFAAFQVGWLYYVARATALAANANVFATYAGALAPPLASPGGRAALIAALIGGITWLNMVGVKRAVRLLDALTLLKALPIIGLAVWGLIAFGDRVPAPAPVPDVAGVSAAALLILYAFIGFENLLVPAGETERPERTIPRALLITVGGTAALYFLVQLAYVTVMPPGGKPDAPLVAFATILAGAAGALVISLAALFSVAGNISGTVTSTPRVTYALAEAGALPAWFGSVNARWATPANSILFMGVLGTTLALSGSFVWLAVVSTLARMIVFSVSFAALPAAERQAGKGVGLRVLAMMLPALAICLWAAAQSEWRSWAMLAALLALGCGLYGAAKLSRR